MPNDAFTIQILCTPSPNLSNISAWDLLKRILDENIEVRPKFPHALISSIVTDPTEKDTTVPSRIEEIEKDMDVFRNMQMTQRFIGIKDYLEFCNIMRNTGAASANNVLTEFVKTSDIN